MRAESELELDSETGIAKAEFELDFKRERASTPNYEREIAI